MPKVRASSGMIGTIRLPISLSRNRSLKMRTSAMVVATCCLPDPFAVVLIAEEVSGRNTLVVAVRRLGRKPPSVLRRSSMYSISGASLPGW